MPLVRKERNTEVGMFDNFVMLAMRDGFLSCRRGRRDHCRCVSVRGRTQTRFICLELAVLAAPRVFG